MCDKFSKNQTRTVGVVVFEKKFEDIQTSITNTVKFAVDRQAD